MTRTEVEVVLAEAVEPEEVELAVGATMAEDCMVAWSMSMENWPRSLSVSARDVGFEESRGGERGGYRRSSVARSWRMLSHF